MAELVDALDLGSSASAWGFDSPSSHQSHGNYAVCPELNACREILPERQSRFRNI